MKPVDQYSSLTVAIQALRDDRTLGASELARMGLRIAAETARQYRARSTEELITYLNLAADQLAHTRPSMAPVWNLLQQWRNSLGTLAKHDLEFARATAITAAHSLEELSIHASRAAARNAARMIEPNSTIITHSLSSTVVEVFRQLKGRGIRVIVSESRPLYEGRNLATLLSGMKIPVTLITDAQIGIFCREAAVALTGADCILEDGAVVNKAGTYLLALASRDQRVPFYVCYESFKQRLPDMESFTLESMDPEELGTPKPSAISVKNVYFDITPRTLVDGWITEQGAKVIP
ncbi:MAG: translation initiation factor eIF-2B [Gammaproteobacteria bacterium]|nr:translation initiation factor eIF-2B [Gammaproteobacteria bacterium]